MTSIEIAGARRAFYAGDNFFWLARAGRVAHHPGPAALARGRGQREEERDVIELERRSGRR
jgi:hypothetical protein